MDIPYKWMEEMLQTVAVRPGKYTQGDQLYGVQTANVENEAMGGQVTDDTERAKQQYQKLKSEEYPLYNPDIHAVVVWSGRVSSVGPSNMRDTQVVSPGEEVIATLTDIEILAFYDVGTPVPEDSQLSL